MVQSREFLPFGLSLFKTRKLMNSNANSFGEELENEVLSIPTKTRQKLDILAKNINIEFSAITGSGIKLTNRKR